MKSCGSTNPLVKGEAFYKVVMGSGKSHTVRLRFERCAECYPTLDGYGSALMVHALQGSFAFDVAEEGGDDHVILANHIEEFTLVSIRDTEKGTH